MHIKIKPNAAEFTARPAVSLDPPLSVEEFQGEIQALEKALELMTFQPDEKWLIELGHRLFQRVKIPCDSTSEQLVLEIEPELMDLPWEFLHDGSRFLVLNPGILRYISHKPATRCAPVDSDRLHVTAMLCSPLLNYDPDVYFLTTDKGLYDPLHVQPTVLNFRQEVKGFTDFEGQPFPLLFDLFRRTRKRTFREALTQSCHVLHFSGHGNRG